MDEKIKNKVRKIQDKYCGEPVETKLYYAIKETETEMINIINKFEKEHTKVLKTEDIISKNIIISDYIKWDDFRKLYTSFKPKTK